MMRIGRIANWYGKGFGYVKDAGLEFVEMCCNSAEEAAGVVRDKDVIRAELAKAELPFSCLGRWNHDIQQNGKIDPDKVPSYLDLLDTAVVLGAKTFVCGCNYDNSISLFRNYENAIGFFGTLCDHAKGKNIKVAVQNCDWNNFVVSPKQWEVILGELPDLYIKFDASHAYNRGENYLEELSDWGERVAHVHIKGTTHAGRRGVDDPPAGMDDIRWGSLFSVLYARHYDGDLSLEPHSAVWMGELGEAGVRFTRDYIRRFVL